MPVELGWMQEEVGGPFEPNTVLTFSINELLIECGVALPAKYIVVGWLFSFFSFFSLIHFFTSISSHKLYFHQRIFLYLFIVYFGEMCVSIQLSYDQPVMLCIPIQNMTFFDVQSRFLHTYTIIDFILQISSTR